MDIKRRILINRFVAKDTMFKDTKEYLTDCVEKSNLSSEKLRYLYNNLYNTKSLFLQQNLFPVCEFLRKGYSIEECEKITHYLEDATSIFADKVNKGKLYNKQYYDLCFAYNTYDKHIRKGFRTEEALRKTIFELSATDLMQREAEMHLAMQEYIDTSRFEFYKKHLSDNIRKLEKKVQSGKSKGLDMYKLDRNKNVLHRLKRYMIKQEKTLSHQLQEKNVTER